MSVALKGRIAPIAITIATAVGVVVFTVPAKAREVRHGASTSVSRDRPRPDVNRSRPHGPDSNRPGNSHPDRIDNWTRPNPRPDHNRPNYNRPDHNRPGPDYNRPRRPHGGDGGYYYGGHDRYDHHRDRYWNDRDDDDFWEFLGAAAIVSAGITVIGSATSEPPSETCVERVVNAYTYLECGERWYVRVKENDRVMYQQVRSPY